MRSRIFNPWSMRISDVLLHLILHLSVHPFSGLVCEAASSPIKITPAFWCVWNIPVGVIALYNTWTFGKISRDLLRYCGFPFDCSCLPFSEEALNMSENLMTISARSGEFIYFWIVLTVSSLVSGLLSIVPLFSGGIFTGYWLSLMSLCVRGSKVLRRTAPQLQDMSWKVFSLTSGFIIL